jgi:hypothetical protein
MTDRVAVTVISGKAYVFVVSCAGRISQKQRGIATIMILFIVTPLMEIDQMSGVPATLNNSLLNFRNR